MDGSHARHHTIDTALDLFRGSPAASGGPRACDDHAPQTAWRTGAAAAALFCIAVLLLTGAIGCADRVSLIPNSDPGLQKTKTEFAADAKLRAYPAAAPRGGTLNGRAAYDYESNTLQVANFGPESWAGVELWVNRQWVVFVPKVEGMAQTAKTLNFEMLYDATGKSFPTDNVNADSMVRKVEVLRQGKLYDLAAVPAD
jgi:hypothetical protein